MAEYVTGVGALLSECPVWEPDAGLLWWLDIEGRNIRRYDPTADAEQVWPTPDKPGSMALCGDGRLLVAMRNSVGWLDPADGSFTPWRDLEPGEASNRMNDGRCDRVGRFWVGSMDEYATEGVFTGKLHRVDPDGAHTTLRDGVGVSNGLAFSPEGDRMYFADSMRSTVWRYRYDLDTGSATDPEVFSDWSGLPGVPDGAAVDETGCYWVACAFGWSLARLTPEGEIDRIVELPVEIPTMPAFGGSDLDTIFITSIGPGGGFPTEPGQPQAGGVFAVDAGVSGLAEPRFAG
ncbi:MAG: SMP-30/gluconolactonase/LRE family protein [bacterium]|nr:SMP-30/gluconolactonase/LRE family protein [bacterium]